MIKIISFIHPHQLRIYSYSQITNYTRRGQHRPPLNLNIGDNIGLFKLKGKDYYRDFDIHHLQMQHQTGTKCHFLECSEENNTFSIIFPTPNQTKKGLNLALQKLLQCGSRKYAVRDLLKHASNRSFSKLSPIQTTDEYLMFSFNTPILKDFGNLLNVYFSMLFNPLLRKQDFYQVVRRFTYQNNRLGFTGDLATELFEGQFQLDQTIYTLINSQLFGIDKQTFCKTLDLAHLSYQDVYEHYKQTINLANCMLVLHGDMNPQYFSELFAKNIQQFKPKFQAINIKNIPLDGEIQLPKTVNFEHLMQSTILMICFKIENHTQQESTLLEILSYLLFDMPDSPFMRYNSPQIPYPPLYGYRQRYFNIGFAFNESKSETVEGSVEWFKERHRILIQKQKQLFEILGQASKRLNDKMIQRCLMHLQGKYYESQGINIIESITQRLLEGKKLTSAFEVTSLISKLLKSYRKQQIFENLIKKYLMNNNNYIVIRGTNNPDIIEYENNRNRSLLFQMHKSLPSDKIKQIQQYSSPNYLQDLQSIPSVSPSQLQFFQQRAGEEVSICNIRTVYSEKINGNKFTFKFDLTDLGQQDIPILPLFCKAFPAMGYKTMKSNSYRAVLQNFIGKIEMNHQTVRISDGGLKVYAYLTIQFTDRNFEYAVNILNGLFFDFDYNNLFELSKALHDSATNCFHQVSENLLHYHAIHLAASKSPYAFFESPIYQARTLCAIASDVKKVTNPKSYLVSLSRKFQEIWEKMMGWSRIELLWETPKQKKSFYLKYLSIILKQIQNEGIKPESIDVTTFPGQKWQKYFPNYDDQIVFQAFKIPYFQKHSPAALVLSSLVNQSISNYNTLGGCFLFKGALISFIQGGRQKYLEMQDHYRRIDNLDIAKRKIFQGFNRFSVLQQFKSGISFQQARFFKQAVIAVQKSEVQALLENYLFKDIKEGLSSQLALGPKLENYEPLLKKGWQIQRSIDDVSLRMQSLNRQEIAFKSQKYIDIC